jgi:hypothetical protein
MGGSLILKHFGMNQNRRFFKFQCFRNHNQRLSKNSNDCTLWYVSVLNGYQKWDLTTNGSQRYLTVQFSKNPITGSNVLPWFTKI